jgi:GNAT superfamily N-acetyltransferase
MNEYRSKREELLTQSDAVIFAYSDRWVSGHWAFAEKMWPDKLRRRNEAYNRWKFKGPDHGDVNGLLLAVVDGKVVGQLGLIPDRLWVDGKIYDAQWACDLMVDDDYRQMGLGSMLFAVAMDRGLVTLGSQPSPLAEITMSRIGFKPLIGPAKMFLPLDISVLIGWKLRGTLKSLVPFISKMIQPINNFRIKALVRRKSGDTRFGGLQDVAPLVIQQQSTQKEPHILHDKEFLTWRYAEPYKPSIKTILGPEGGYAICEATSQYFYVYDWHAANKEQALALFPSIIHQAKESISKNILVFANSHLEKKLLKQQGFFQLGKKPANIIYHSDDAILEGYKNIHYCIYDSDGNL